MSLENHTYLKMQAPLRANEENLRPSLLAQPVRLQRFRFCWALRTDGFALSLAACSKKEVPAAAPAPTVAEAAQKAEEAAKQAAEAAKGAAGAATDAAKDAGASEAAPVIIGDNCFLGSRSIVVEGVRLENEVVLGANVVLTMSTKIIDVSGPEPIEFKGIVPARSVVIPGSYTKKFPAGEYQVPCALIIGKRKESTDTKTSLNDALRDFQVAV